MLELFVDGRAPVVLADGLAMGNAMQLGPDGFLYYPHMLTSEVYRVPVDGGPAELVAEQVHEPVAVRFDRDGVLVVLSRGAEGIVTRVHADGSRSVVASGVPGLDNAAFDDDNRMFVSSFACGGITELRADGRPRSVVAQGFGYGAHHCLGAPPARMELQVALRTLLTRLPGLRIAGTDEDVVWKSGLATRAPEHFPIAWDVS